MDRTLCATRAELEFLLVAAGLRRRRAYASTADLSNRSRDRRSFTRLSDRRRALLGAVGTSASGSRPAAAGVQGVYGIAGQSSRPATPNMIAPSSLLEGQYTVDYRLAVGALSQIADVSVTPVVPEFQTVRFLEHENAIVCHPLPSGISAGAVSARRRARNDILLGECHYRSSARPARGGQLPARAGEFECALRSGRAGAKGCG